MVGHHLNQTYIEHILVFVTFQRQSYGEGYIDGTGGVDTVWTEPRLQ